MNKFIPLVLALVFVGGAAFYFLKPVSPDSLLQQEPEEFNVPLGLPPIPWPKDNPYTKKKAELGRLLYFDKRLSADGTVSCATCHSIPRAFTDNLPIAIGINHHKGSRNSPTVINSAYQPLLFWDGRAKSLEEQCKGPIANPNEMSDTPNVHKAHEECHKRVCLIEGYKVLFKEAFGESECSIDQIAKAISTFERTVLSGNSKYDRRELNDEELNGLKVFKAKGCSNCHYGPNFTDDQFHNIGVGMDRPNPDVGRFAITKDPKDTGAFKTPVLREVSRTHPYMHDGSIKTLAEVVDFYDKGGVHNPYLHQAIRPLHLTEKEKKDLISFMEALNGEGWQHFSEPSEFPK